MRKHNNIVIKVLIIFLIILVFFKKIDIEEVTRCLLNINQGIVFVAFVLVCVMCAFLTLKWKILLDNISFIQLLQGILIQHIVTYSLGGQLLGEGSKILAFRKKQEDKSKIVASILVDKITSFLGVFLMGLFGMAFSKISLPNQYKLFYFCIVGGCICIISGLFNNKTLKLLSEFAKWMKDRNCLLKKTSEILWNVFLALQQYVSEPKRILLSILAGIVLQFISVSVSFLLFYAMDITIGFGDLCWIISLTSVISVIPLSIMGMGVNQISTISLLVLVGITKESAAGYSLVLYVLMIGVAILATLLLLFLRKKNIYVKK